MIAYFLRIIEDKLMSCVVDCNEGGVLVFLGHALGSVGVHPVIIAIVKLYWDFALDSLKHFFDCMLGFEWPFKYDIKSCFAAGLSFAQFKEILSPSLIFLIFELESIVYDPIKQF